MLRQALAEILRGRLSMKATMKAMLVEAHGGPEVIKPREVATPKPGVGEVLLRVRGCSLNHLDVWVRSGMPGIKLPLILGCDVAGEVVERGENVDHLATGDKVMVDPGLSCGVCRECLSGEENLCRQYSILGAGRNGGYAEYVTIPAADCFSIPERLTFQQAASIPLVFLTAWHMLLTRAQIKPNETVLVVGGGSGVGTAAIQIAKLFHSRVITTVGNDAHAARAKELGADEVILHSKQKISEEVKKLTGKTGVDVVFEHVGPAWFTECMN